MTIWAFNEPSEEAKQFVVESLNNGISRFGWSYLENADLRYLDSFSWAELNKDQTEILKKQSFLLSVKPGDWIVHINVPEWGECTAVEVLSEYEWDKTSNAHFLDYTPTGDYRHIFEIDSNTKMVFSRKDANVKPSVRLKGMRRYWRIYQTEAFLESIANLRNNSVKLNGESRQMYHFRHDLEEYFSSITKSIHANNNQKDLEDFIATFLWNVPTVVDVKLNRGWGTDNGADIIVTYKSGFPLKGLEIDKKIVFQIKSFKGDHFDLKAVKDIERAFEKYQDDVEAGVIISTGNKTDLLEKAVEDLAKRAKKPVVLIAGQDVAKFVMKFGSPNCYDI